MLSQKTQVRMKKMAKKDLNEDILSGGSISDSAKSEKSAKKAEKLAEKAKRMPRKKLRLIRKFRNSEVSLLPKPMKKPKRHSRKSLIGQRLSRMRSAAKKAQLRLKMRQLSAKLLRV